MWIIVCSSPLLNSAISSPYAFSMVKRNFVKDGCKKEQIGRFTYKIRKYEKNGPVANDLEID